MEENTLGNKIRNRRIAAPFTDMTVQQKRPISSIVCKDPTKAYNCCIYLIACIVTDSKVDKHMEIEEYINEAGLKDHREVEVPNKCAVIRYKKVVNKTMDIVNGEMVVNYVFEKKKLPNGVYSDVDEEFYSFTGSSVLIDQIENEITEDMLPAITVITECVNQSNKKFLKFT